ncbi:MAG: ATP-binding protein [bacterium]|nr:ATP-binding protein [bacterium]
MKQTPIGTKQFTFTTGIIDALGANLYERDTALVELIANGRDACFRKGTVPWIEITKLRRGESKVFNGETLVVTDHGDGFRDSEDWSKYLMIGESPHRHDPKLFGMNGIGKFAAFFFNPDEYMVRTCPDEEGDVQVLRVRKEDLLREGTADNFFLSERGDLSTDPKEGSFTSIVIENMRVLYPEDRIREEIPPLLSIEDWRVFLNGTPLPRRKSLGEDIIIQTPPMPDGIGTITCRLGITEQVSTKADAVMVTGGGRLIGRLDELPQSADIPECLFHPHLYGTIDVEGWLKQTTISKTQLRGDTATGPGFNTFTKALKSYVQEPVEKALIQIEEAGAQPNKVTRWLENVGKDFTKAFGPPVVEGEEEKTGVPATRDRSKRQTPGTVRPTGTGPGHEKTKKPGPGEGSQTYKGPSEGEDNPLYVRVEDKTYRIFPTKSAEPLPASITSRGTTLILAINHKRFQKAVGRGSNAFRTFLEHAIAEAHVRHLEPGETSTNFARRVDKVLARI